jgi:hypothetical protein
MQVKGKNSLALSRDLGVSHKACWILLHKVREAMSAEYADRKLGGEGKEAEIDGGYFGGYVKPANLREIAKIFASAAICRASANASLSSASVMAASVPRFQSRERRAFLDQVARHGWHGFECR